jgi:hypothetical protein
MKKESKGRLKTKRMCKTRKNKNRGEYVIINIKR